MDISARLVAVVRRIVGLPDDPGAPPRIDRLAFYRAEVKAASSDGATVDVVPADPRIPATQGVPLLTGIPGAVAVVKAGSIVWLGWDGGDPTKPKAFPVWESATVSKLTVTVGGQTLVMDDGNKKATLTVGAHIVTVDDNAKKITLDTGGPKVTLDKNAGKVTATAGAAVVTVDNAGKVTATAGGPTMTLDSSKMDIS